MDCFGLSKFLRLALGEQVDVCKRFDLMLGRILMLNDKSSALSARMVLTPQAVQGDGNQVVRSRQEVDRAEQGVGSSRTICFEVSYLARIRVWAF